MKHLSRKLVSCRICTCGTPYAPLLCFSASLDPTLAESDAHPSPNIVQVGALVSVQSFQSRLLRQRRKESAINQPSTPPSSTPNSTYLINDGRGLLRV